MTKWACTLLLTCIVAPGISTTVVYGQACAADKFGCLKPGASCTAGIPSGKIGVCKTEKVSGKPKCHCNEVNYPAYYVRATSSFGGAIRGDSGFFTVNVSPVNGYSGNVTLSCNVTGSGAPPPTCAFDTNPILGGSGRTRLRVASSKQTPGGGYNIALGAKDGSGQPPVNEGESLLWTVSIPSVSNFCPFGSCDISHPLYQNVYWDNSAAQWDSDVANTDASMKQYRVDALMAAIANSGFFQPLQQYSVVNGGAVPSLTVACQPVPATIQEALNTVGQFANCVMANSTLNPGNVILNVFLPPQVAPSSADGWCAGPGTTIGMHDKFGSSVEITVIPTNKACNADMGSLFKTLSHEMVEAATDPIPASPTGWKQPFWNGGNEIGDLCEDFDSSPFMYGNVPQYWSDRDQNCTTGIVLNPPEPSIAQIDACGVGNLMGISLTGNFHAVPWDLGKQWAPGAGTKTMFLQLSISGPAHSWSCWKY